MKKAIAMFLAASILMGFPAMTVAAQDYQGETLQVIAPGIVSPKWDNTSAARVSLSANGNTLSASAYVRAKSNNATCSGYLYVDVLQNGSWTNVKSWYISGTGKINTTKTYKGSKGNTYRARLSVSVAGESISATSSSVWVN